MKANRVVFKNIEVKSEEHFISYLSYVEKSSASVLKTVNDGDSLEVINLQRERLKSKKGKKGRNPAIARDLMFSTPPEIRDIIAKMNENELMGLVDIFIATIMRDLKKNNPNADIKFLIKNLKIVFHRDSDDFHFHVIVPSFTKSTKMFNKDLIALDYGDRSISANARRKMLNTFNKLLLNDSKEMTEEEFAEKAKSQRTKNEQKEKKWSERKKAIIEAETTLKELNKKIELLGLEEKRKEFDKLISTYSQQLLNGNTQRAEKTKDKIEKKFSKIGL